MSKKRMAGALTAFVIFTSLFVVLHVDAATSSFSKLLSYQGKLSTYPAGAAVADATYTFRFRIYIASAGGAAIFDETISTSTSGGLFSVLIGKASSTASLNFNQPLYIGVTVNSDPEMTPRKELSAAPFAFAADTLDGLDSADFLQNVGTSTMSSTSPDTILTVNQQGTGGILSLQKSGVSMLEVTNGGNVGIGTSSPAGNASLTVEATSTNSVALVVRGVASQVADLFKIVNGLGTETLVYTSEGNLGIGTSSPYAKLSVVGEVVASYFTATSTTATSTFGGGLNVTSGCVAVNGVCIEGADGTWSTTSANYWKTDNNFFASTSADHWYSSADRFSSSTNNYWVSTLNKGSFFSTTSADYWIIASTTIPKTSIANTWTGTNIFNDVGVGGDINVSAGSFYGYNSAPMAFASTTLANWFVGGAGNTTLTSTATSTTGVGFQALYSNTTGSKNTGVGSQSLFSNMTGHDNTALGAGSLTSNLSGYDNTAIGSGALLSNATGTTNSAYGVATLFFNDGNNNTAYGAYSMNYNTYGNNNTAIGVGAGNRSVGSGNVFLGYNAGYDETGDNKLYIANSNTASPLVLGDFGTGELTVNGSLYVNNTASSTFTNGIDISGGCFAIGGACLADVTWASTSANYWYTSADRFASSTNDYWLTQNLGDAFSTTSVEYWETTKAIRGGLSGYSTTSADYWKTQRDFYSTTSANYWLTTNIGAAFSSTSANYWYGSADRFASSTNDYWLTQNLGAAFSSTSASYFLAQNLGNAFSSTSANYWLTTNLGNAFSSTSADYWITASSTIPKTTLANTWSFLNIFDAGATTSALTVNGNAWMATTSFAGLINVDGTTGTSTFASNLQVLGQLQIGTGSTYLRDTATSTFTNGVDLVNGCFSIAGVCVGGGTGSYGNSDVNALINASSTIPKTTLANTWSFLNIFDAGATTSALTVNGNAWMATTSFAGLINVDGTTGTSTFASNLQVLGQLQIGTGSTYLRDTATSTFTNGISIADGGIDLAGGCFSIAGVCLGDSLYGDSNVNALINSSSTIPKTTLANTWSFLNIFNAGATTSSLTVNGNAWMATTSFAGLINVDGTTGTSTFASNLQVLGQLQIGTGSTYLRDTATSTFTGGINLAGGCFSIDGVCISLGGPGSGTINYGTTGQLPYYAAEGTSVTATSSILLASSGDVSFGGSVTVAAGKFYGYNYAPMGYASTTLASWFVGGAGTTTYESVATSTTGVGFQTLYSNTTGARNTGVGAQALFANTTGFENTALGAGSLATNTTGYFNTAVGSGALFMNATGTNNSAFGLASLFYNDGNYNSAYGPYSMLSNIYGNDNSAYGYKSLMQNTGGSQNTALGTQAGFAAQGSGNIFLGYQAGYAEPGSNKLYIDNSDTATPLIYGDFSTLTRGITVNGDLRVSNAADPGSTFAAGVADSTGQYPRSVIAASLNPGTDALLDLAVANAGSDNIAVLFGIGDGTFAAQISYTLGEGSNPQSIFSADFNQDSSIDLVTANQGDNTISVLTNNGLGAFSVVGYYVGAGSAPNSVYAANLTADAYPDIITVDVANSKVSIFINDLDGTFTAGNTYSVGSIPDSVYAADFDVDGNMDIAVANHDDSDISVLMGNGLGAFDAKVDYSTVDGLSYFGATGYGPHKVFSADFNGDGKLDLVSTNSGNTISVFLNNGNGTFAPKVDYANGVSACGGSAADFNGDGLMDITASDCDVNYMEVLLGDGDGTFSGKTNYRAGGYPTEAFSADFNGDGKPDIVTANYFSGGVSVFINQYSPSQTVLFADVSTGFVGVGTSSPYAKFSVVGESLASYFTAASTTATSTFANGINLTGGCFAVGGVCIGGTGSYGNSDVEALINASSTIPKTTLANTWSFLNIFNAGATTSALTVNGNAWMATTSFAGLIDVTGVTGTSTFSSNVNVRGQLQIGTGSIYLRETGTSTFSNGISIANGGLDLAGGCFSVSGVCVGSGTVNYGTAGWLPYYAFGGTAVTATSSIFLAESGNIGIGDITPNTKFAVAGNMSVDSGDYNYPIGSVGNPVHKGSIVGGGVSLNGPLDVFVSGDYAYVVSYGSDDLVIVDISNPAFPVYKGSIINGAPGALLDFPISVFVSGNYAYVASRESGALEIVDVSDPTSPVHKGSVSSNSPKSVFVSGNYAYVVGSSGLQIVDISNPALPVQKGILGNGGGALLSDPRAVFVSGNYAYVASLGSDALEIVDVSNPASPVHKGSIIDGGGPAPFLDGPFAVFVSGNYAYVTTFSSDTLEIIDVSNPAVPVSKGSIPCGDPLSVFVSGNYAYVASAVDDALKIIDISNSAAPVLKSSIVHNEGGAVLDGPHGVFVSGNYAYVASELSNSLEIIDISGANISNAQIGSLNIGTLQVSNFAQFNQNVLVGSGLNVGRNAMIDGMLSVGVSSSTAVNPISALFSGRVGIGTTTPNASLTVVGSLCVASTTTGCNDASYDAGTIYANNIDIRGAVDLAENYQAYEDSLESGDLVSVTTEDKSSNTKANSKNSDNFGIAKASETNKNIIGIVSTKPGMTLGGGISNSKPVALSGRVPVKVNLENGPIAIGDRIALSSEAGVGMKMSSISTQSVGIALESYSGESDKDGNGLSEQIGFGRILVFVNLSANQLDSSVAGGTVTSDGLWTADSNGSIKLVSSSVLDMQSKDIINIGKLVSASGKWSINEDGVVTANKLCLDDVCIDKGQLRALLQGANLLSAPADPSNQTESTPALIDETADAEAPLVTLTGAETIELPADGISWIDPGATVTDNKDNNLGISVSTIKLGRDESGDLTEEAGTVISETNAAVDTSAPATYHIKYNTTDGAGNKAAEVSRTVIVGGGEVELTPPPEPIVEPALETPPADPESDPATE